jgi:diguanylate cyclase (GGDEF)-like protein
MWQSITDLGHWQGEIWNRRKDGEIYPQLASISAVKDATGQVSNYVAVFADISSLKKVQADLAFLAHHDPLTELPNRLALRALMLHRLQSAKLHGNLLGLLMIDLDRFKDVNDSYGHPVGDDLLRQVAARLSALSGQLDMVCRFGGDEFTMLLEQMPDTDEAGKMADAVIRSLSEPYLLTTGLEVRIGASVGISIYPAHGDTPELLLQQADSALSKAKSEGRDRFVYFSENLTLAARERIDIEVRLRHAISHGELRVFYQPQVDIATGRMVGAEALVRWQSPTEGLIQPSRFIPIAEASGLIGEIDDWVLRETCMQGQRWIAAGLPPLTLAVNLSPYQFLQGDISTTVAQVLNDTGYPPPHLELELTETALMQHEDEAILILHRLRAMGLRLAIDDFGTGYSSLAYLKLFPLDILKIDKRFIDDIPLHRDDMEIVTAIVAMAHALGLKVLAEGVENDSQLAYLKSQGCNYFQGYLSSRPVPADEFEQLLRRQHA